MRKFIAWIFLGCTLASILPLSITISSLRTIEKTFNGASYESKDMQEIEQRNLILFSLCLLAFLSLLCLTLGIFFCKKSHGWWIISIILSLLNVIVLSFIWYLAYHRGYYPQKEYTPISSIEERDAFIETIKKESTKPFITIPTGIYLEYLFFARKDNDVYPGIIANGIVWQRYKNVPESIERDVFLPNGNQFALKKIFHEKNNDEELVGWHFAGAAMFQHFDLSDFPLDHRHIKIQLLHSDFEKNVILVPDFESYETIVPSSLPGISTLLQIPHWLLHKSMFCYVVQNFGTSFGSKDLSYKHFPQLYYYITAHRKLWDTAIIYLILLLFTAIILFICLLAFLKHKVLTSLLGFSTIGVLGVCSGLLFVLVSSHIELRDNIAIDGTAYLEYFYVIIYLAIIFVALDSVLFTLYEKIRWIQYDNNIIAKLLYWPAITGATLLVTVITFY